MFTKNIPWNYRGRFRVLITSSAFDSTFNGKRQSPRWSLSRWGYRTHIVFSHSGLNLTEVFSSRESIRLKRFLRAFICSTLCPSGASFFFYSIHVFKGWNLVIQKTINNCVNSLTPLVRQCGRYGCIDTVLPETAKILRALPCS